MKHEDCIKVSVNIPIYNASKYLRKCLDSMRSQTLKEIEFVLIDDGSTDNSLQICKEYAKNDLRFKVFHKENGGSASARQLALDNSLGEYIIVCDADDWAEPDMYERLYEIAKCSQVDISTCDYYVNYEDGTQIESTHRITNCSNEQLMRDVLTHAIPPASWIKLIRRKFLEENQINYEKGINLGEDFLFLVKVVLCKPNIIKINLPLYHYRRIMNSGSYTNNPKYSSFLQMEYVYKWINRNVDNEMFGREIFNLANDVGFLGLRIPDMDVLHHKDFLRTCLPISSYLKYCRFNLKYIIIFFSKFNRSICVRIYDLLKRYFYK